MSAINAYRATNVKYNKQQFFMDNLYLSFANDTDLVHALATMPNGFGKGVILQLIFQIFKPMMDWQKGKGRVSQFFHSSSGFNPYTLYSALEWKLDGAEERFLVTGIAISARRVKDGDNAPKTDVYYKLFTIKCDSSSDHRLAKLPYWDEETGESWPLSRWEDYAREFPQQIRLYGEYDLRKFRGYLQEHGIFADEWEEMFDMNQNEAGTTIHFEKLGADHNDGLFRNVIIPSIESNLRRLVGRDGRDLKELFIEVAKIAHNLNTLLSRKSAMTGLLGMLEEVDGVYLKLQDSEREQNNHAKRGSYLKSGLIERIEEAVRDLATLEIERHAADDDVKDARFQLKNLTYIEEQYKLSDLGKKIRELKATVETVKSNAIEKKHLKEEAELAITRKEYEDISRQLENTISQIKSLMMREQLTDVKAQQEEMEQNIEKEWPSLIQNLSQTVNDAIGYQSVLGTNIQMAENEVNEVHGEGRKISKDIGIIEEKIRSFQSKLKEMEARYNVNNTYTLPQLIKLTVEDLERCIESFECEKDLNGQLSQQCANLERDNVKLETQVEQEEAVIQSLNDIYMKQLKLEVDAAIKLQPFSGSELPWHQEKYVSWLKEQLPELAAEASRMEHALRREEEEIRRLESENMITEGGFWVPNPTILQLRDAIKSHGYTCLLGTEFIQERSESERERLKQNAIFLPYGLIILEKEREQVLRLAAFKNRVLFHPVPLFSVEIIDGLSSPSFITVSNRADEIGFSPEALKMYLIEAEEELQRRNNKLKHAFADLNNFKSALKFTEKALDSEQCAEQLGEECQALEEVCERKKMLISEHKREIEILQNKIAGVRNTLQELQEELKDIENKKIALEELDKSWNDHKLNEKKLTELSAYEELAKAKIQKITDNKQEAQKELEEQKRLYSDWKNSIQPELERFREAIPALPAFDFQSHVPSIFPPAYWPTIPSSIEVYFSNWRVCQQTLEQASVEMTRLETFKGVYVHQQEEKRRELFALNEMWEKKVTPTESLDVLKLRRKQHEEDFEEADLKRQKYEVQLSDLQGSERTMITHAEKLKNEIENEFKPWEVDYRSGIDVENQHKEFNFKLSQANEKLQSAKTSIGETLRRKSIWEQSSEALQHLSESNHRVPRDVYIEVGTDAKSAVRDWVKKSSELDKELGVIKTSSFQAVKGVQKKIKEAKWDDEMKQHGDDFFDSLLVMDEAVQVRQKISEAKTIYEGILEREEANLNQAQEAELRWVQTATEHSRQIINHISEMVKGMSIRNRYSYSFPLMKLKDESMPRIEEIESRMKELFRQTLRFIEDKKVEFSRLNKGDLGKRLDPGDVVYAAYNYTFPTMQVYNMNIENTFWVDKPYEKYFKDWEVFLQGSDEESTGSGGQRLAAFTLLSIMITTQKRRRDKQAKRSVLINDNPFANAVSEHVLDPIFRVADALGIQWIVVAPPELVKLEVSERFPSYYALDLESDGTGKRKVVVSSRHIRNRVEFQQLEFTS